MDMTEKTLNTCLKVLREEAVPPGLGQRILEHIESELETTRILRNLRWATTVGMAMLLVSFITIWGTTNAGKSCCCLS